KGGTVQSNEVINTFEGVADYIVKYGRLPDNF
nr:Bpo III=13.18 kda ribonuclease isoform III {N-terminal} [Bacillus polymyxa, 514, Peptide Partial, 31 aa] [Paenibacillus polymyxa]